MTRETRVRIKWLVRSVRVEREGLQKELDFKVEEKERGSKGESCGVEWRGVSTSTSNTTQENISKNHLRLFPTLVIQVLDSKEQNHSNISMLSLPAIPVI